MNGKMIKELAESRGLTMKELGQNIGLSQQGMSRIVKTGSTHTETLERIAAVLKCHPGDFFESEFSKFTQATVVSLEKKITYLEDIVALQKRLLKKYDISERTGDLSTK